MTRGHTHIAHTIRLPLLPRISAGYYTNHGSSAASWTHRARLLRDKLRCLAGDDGSSSREVHTRHASCHTAELKIQYADGLGKGGGRKGKGKGKGRGRW